VLAVAKSLLQVCSIRLNHSCQGRREWEGEDGEAKSLWPLSSIPTHEKRQRGN
ncbi:unnamed protein product, partial [Bubo scandiacus]